VEQYMMFTLRFLHTSLGQKASARRGPGIGNKRNVSARGKQAPLIGGSRGAALSGCHFEALNRVNRLATSRSSNRTKLLVLLEHLAFRQRLNQEEAQNAWHGTFLRASSLNAASTSDMEIAT
jgi:hypothetical protein